MLPRLNETFDVVFTDPPYGDYQYYLDLSLLSLSVIGEYDENTITQCLQKEVVLRNKNDLERYKNGLYEVFYHTTSKLAKDGKLIVTFHHHDESVLYAFLEVFKDLPVRLHAVYPVIGESSGKLVKRRLYLDLILVFGKRRRSIHYSFTKFGMTEEDDKLQKCIVKLIDFYEKNKL